MQANIAEWISRLFIALQQVGEHRESLESLEYQMTRDTDCESTACLKKAFEKQRTQPIVLDSIDYQEVDESARRLEARRAAPEAQPLGLEALLGTVTPHETSLEGLDRWENTDFDQVHQLARLSRLIQCLSASSEEIRLRALATIQTLMHTLKSSTYSEKASIYILLGIISETIKSGPGPPHKTSSIIIELATAVLVILNDPSNKLYGKANNFLNRSATWEVSRVIPCWIDKILLKEPDDDDGHPFEVEWLLEVLVNGLRNTEDMEVYRKSNVFERVLALYASVQTTGAAKLKICQMVYRAVRAGGAMTLVTRVGILSWIDVMLTSARGKEKVVLLALRAEVEKAVDVDEIKKWKDRMVSSKAPAMAVVT